MYHFNNKGNVRYQGNNKIGDELQSCLERIGVDPSSIQGTQPSFSPVIKTVLSEHPCIRHGTT
jgi:hypothetical protein